MEQSSIPVLEINPQFKNLIPPLTRREYRQLEQNLMEDGCIDPIITWNGMIVDGHNRYEICHKHNILFQVMEMEFECQEEAIAWICSHQLGRRNITEETRKYLIGMQYESEKTVNTKRNEAGINQYTYSDTSEEIPADPSRRKAEVPSGHKTAKRIADEHHIAWNTVQKYATYTKAMEIIAAKTPDVASRILAGRYKISHNNIMEMANLSPENIRRVIARVEASQQEQTPFFQYKRTRQELHSGVDYEDQAEEPAPGPTIKDMPEFDPDAELTSLALTIPSWASTIRRTRERANLKIVTPGAKKNLMAALADLTKSVFDLASALKEK